MKSTTGTQDTPFPLPDVKFNESQVEKLLADIHCCTKFPCNKCDMVEVVKQAIKNLLLQERIDEASRAETFSRNEVFGAMPISLARYYSDRIKQLEAAKEAVS